MSAFLAALANPNDVVLPFVIVGIALVVTLVLMWYLSLDL